MPQDPVYVEAMAATCRVSVKRFQNLYRRLRPGYDRGEFDGALYWARIAAAAKVTLGPRDVRDLIELDIRSWARVNTPLVDWLESLRAADIRLALLSNMPIEERNRFGRMFSWFKRFDHLSISSEVRSLKPDVAIFQHCLEGLSAKPGEVLFIDDLSVNTRAATKLGMNTIQFESNEHLAQAIAPFGLPPLAT
jgi:HAD superfamily hydrolase (TIGR01509 family)